MSAHLRQIIREELIHLIEDMTNVHTNDTVKDIPPWLTEIPGAPFQGRIFFTGAIINNESRELLKRWLKFAILAKKKFGDPTTWPQNVCNMSQQLAGEYENKVTERGFSSTYRQF
jgi:hypothetical protein